MLAYLANLTTFQIVIGLAGGLVLVFLAKVIFDRGGPRHRMKQNRVIWIVVPLVVAVGGGIAWLVIKVMGPAGGFHL
ncbi:MAG TPA: hypothetical protein VGF42_01970 [Caulobacteraceae bacterium]|jgi:hypothetical protein